MVLSFFIGFVVCLQKASQAIRLRIAATNWDQCDSKAEASSAVMNKPIRAAAVRRTIRSNSPSSPSRVAARTASRSDAVCAGLADRSFVEGGAASQAAISAARNAFLISRPAACWAAPSRDGRRVRADEQGVLLLGANFDAVCETPTAVG
jgi:hypothetical protein